MITKHLMDRSSNRVRYNMINFNDAVRRIAMGSSVDDVVNSLVEAEVTKAHQHLGSLKDNLRKLKTLAGKGFESSISGTPTPKQLMAAKSANKQLKDLTDYFLTKRIPAILEIVSTEGVKSREFETMCDEVHAMLNNLVNANVNDTITTTAIKATEAAGELDKSV